MIVSNGFPQSNKQRCRNQSGNGVGIDATTASKRFDDPSGMPPLKVHQYRGEPRGRDCIYHYTDHSTA